MRRFVFNLFAFVSLVLCVGSVGLWARKNYESDDIKWRRSSAQPTDKIPGTVTEWEAFNGTDGLRFCKSAEIYDVQIAVEDHFETRSDYRSWWKKAEFRDGVIYTVNTPQSSEATLYCGNNYKQYAIEPLNRLGFDYTIGGCSILNYPDRGRMISIGCPAWFAAGLFSILPLVWEIRHRHWFNRRQRVKRKLCAECGYDVRASNSCCPECGTPVPS
jgi:hypothetical protein